MDLVFVDKSAYVTQKIIGKLTLIQKLKLFHDKFYSIEDYNCVNCDSNVIFCVYFE